MQKIRAVGDNYERAGAAVISYLEGREEVDSDKIGIYGVSMGSYWSLKLASYDHRMAAIASGVACFNPNNTIFFDATAAEHYDHAVEAYRMSQSNIHCWLSRRVRRLLTAIHSLLS